MTPRIARQSVARFYRKKVGVLAFVAAEGGEIDTLEGRMHFRAGDYICGPGAAGEYWPVRKDIFERTYVLDEPDDKP